MLSKKQFKFLLFFFFNFNFLFAESYLEKGIYFYNLRNNSKDINIAVSNINLAIENFNLALKEEPKNELLLYYLAKSIEFKYAVLPLNFSKETCNNVFIDMIKKLENSYKEDSKFLNYALILMWGRYGENMSLIEAAKKGIANVIKKYGERLYKLDKKFENGAACLVLGRLHYKTPSIPFVLTWPSLKESKKYLKEGISLFPNSLWLNFYIADTLYELNEKDDAKVYYRKVLEFVPRPENYFEDLNCKKLCEVRVKELNLNLH